MVWCVCAHHDVNHSRLPTQLTARGMVAKRLSRWRFGLWSHVDYVFFLVLLLVCHPVQSSSNSPPPISTVTEGTTANTTSAHLSTTKSATNSYTVSLSTNLIELNTTVTEISTTSSYRSTTNPETTLTAASHSTDDITKETTPYASTETTTISLSTENTASSEATTITPSTETPTTIFTSTESTTFSEATTITPSTENTTTIFTSTENTSSSEATTITPSTENTTTIFTSTENTTSSEATTITPSTENTTTIFTSTENKTSSEATTITPSTENTTTIFTSTENTTLSVITTNSTFTATPDPSSSAYTNDTTPLLPASTPCYCSNEFYWMTAFVDVMGTPQSEQNVTTQFEEYFGHKLNACKVQTNLTAVLTTTSISSVTQELSLFEAMELTCDQKNITTNAYCYILLKTRAPANVCCIRNTVTEMNSNISVSVVGQIERVGVCADNMTHIFDGQYDKCNHTLNVCNETSQNVSCGNSTNVIFPLVTGAPEDCSSPPSPTCHCTSRCNSSDFYYYSNITFSHTMENAESQISNVFKNSAYQNMTLFCNISQTFKSRIQDSNVICEKNVTAPPICEIIVKLDTYMDLCCLHVALEAVLEPLKNFSIFVGVVKRVAICFNTSSDSLQQTLKWQPSLSTNFSSDVCMESNRQNLNGYCSAGSSIIPLNESCSCCSSSTIPFQNFTTAPPSFTSTSLSNITNNATVTQVSTSANVTTSPANVTSSASVSSNTSVSSTTSGTVNSDELLNLSANASSLSDSEVEKLLSQLESLLSGPNVSLALANTSVNIVNNLLDVPVAVINPYSKRAITIVDTVGLKLVVSETSQSVLSQSLALGVKKVDGANFQETSFSLLESSNLQIRSNPGPEAQDIVFRIGSSPLGSVTLPALLTQNLTAEQKQLASRVQFNFFQKSTFFQDKSLGNRKLNSKILSSSVGNLSLSGLQKEVLITLRNTEPIPANYVASCVFWDFSLNDGSGGWNPSGCRVVISSAEETQCACNHLTSFGILLDISKTVIPPEHLIILTYITYIGCGISAIFLSITLLTYLAFGKLRKDIPSKILIQLCLALLMLNLVFLVDSWLALYPDAVGLCISTAFFLHYFLLASFTWMALEAVHMYLALVKVFNTYISRFMVKIGFAGWGIPLIVVIIVIAINKDNYGLVTYGKLVNGATSDFCWIKNDIAFYVAVVAYFCLVFLLNFAMFIVVMIQLYRIKKQNPHNVQYRSGWQEMRSVAGLTVLLGLTWGFAFFAWGPVNLAFMYLFAIFNSLQGLFIFVFHCAMKENVRRQWRTYLCCGKLRTSENSDWSRTATQNINKASRERTPFHSSISNNSRLSFLNHDSLSSDVPMGVGNPVDDRIMTAAEESMSGSDVVLNEINDHYRGQRSY